MVDPARAASRVRFLAGHGPAVRPSTARAVSAGLRRAAATAPAIVAEVTDMRRHLAGLRAVPISVLTRVGWAEMAGRSAAHLLPATDSAVKDRLVTEEMGVALSFMAPRILGQYDLFAPGPATGRMLLVAPNVWSFTTAWDLDARDVQLYVAVHEYVHALQFLAGPWLRDYLTDLAADVFAGKMGELDRIAALMAVLEGHAEHVTNHVPVRTIPSIYRIRSAMAQRRSSAGALEKVVGKILGADLKIAQYTDGAAFVGAIEEAGGPGAVARLWEGPENLPSPDEIKEPAAWMTRVLS